MEAELFLSFALWRIAVIHASLMLKCLANRHHVGFTKNSEMSFTEILQELPKLTESERQELREWLDGYDPETESEWTRIAMERIRQLDAGLAPLDGDQVLEEMRRLAKQLAHG